MGMAASQARLLSITARLSNNEMEQQSLAYSKQRLADNSEQINQVYLDALAKTKYQVLTGYNGSNATYADISYNQLTGYNSVAAGKQYLVMDNNGKVVVSSNIAKAYSDNNGDFNRFLASLGYTQADIDVTKKASSEAAVHNAWDKYLASVGKSINDMDSQHILGFDYESFGSDSFDGYPTYNAAASTDSYGQVESLYKDSEGYYRERYLLQARNVENEDGSTETVVCYQTAEQEGTDLWNVLDDVEYNVEEGKFIYKDSDGKEISTEALYADPNETLVSENSKNYLILQTDGTYLSEGGVTYTVSDSEKALNFEGTTTAQRELYDYATALTEAYYNNSVSGTTTNLKYDAGIVNYYKNIFNEMRTKGYTTVNDETNLKETDWFVKQLKAGKLQLAYYSTVEKSFIGTSLDSDESIAEKEDTSAMVIAEQVYQTAMDKIESQDKQIDLQLNKLESEHSALSTEYEAVKGVIKKNVETSFKTFNA